MKFIALLLFASVATASFIHFDPPIDDQWETFKKTFGKVYHDGEELTRRSIWEKNIVEVEYHNHLADMGFYTYRKGINKYSDLSSNEIAEFLKGLKSADLQSSSGSNWVEPFNVYIPDKVDWRAQGLVTPVKDQEFCASCWAFSATGSLEGQHKKRTGKLISLSEQNLIDCSWKYGNLGCYGGRVEWALKYIQDNLGIDTEDSYPYSGKNNSHCGFKRASVGARCTGIVYLPSGDEESLKKAVATVGPISVSIDTNHTSFMLYKSGIYDEKMCSPSELDHAVLVIGYGTENGADYWLVKNR
ncbi:cathepsin L-like peptidase [Parasteatoda tepidariorum]|uniref:cathepsin L-like peptidase n=1 Tax=Parasteatoda tepidariorum TaxID=114398 RepID=UPI0039BCDF50